VTTDRDRSAASRRRWMRAPLPDQFHRRLVALDAAEVVPRKACVLTRCLLELLPRGPRVVREEEAEREHVRHPADRALLHARAAAVTVPDVLQHFGPTEVLA